MRKQKKLLQMEYMEVKKQKNYLTMVFNYKKNKKLDLCMV